MAMNCKPNEIARIVNSNTGNNNRLVMTREFVQNHVHGQGWECEALQTIINPHGGTVPPGTIVFSADAHLRPIRDQPGEDETLQWAPVPGVPVTA